MMSDDEDEFGELAAPRGRISHHSPLKRARKDDASGSQLSSSGFAESSLIINSRDDVVVDDYDLEIDGESVDSDDSVSNFLVDQDRLRSSRKPGSDAGSSVNVLAAGGSMQGDNSAPVQCNVNPNEDSYLSGQAVSAHSAYVGQNAEALNLAGAAGAKHPFEQAKKPSLFKSRHHEKRGHQ